MLLGKTTLTVRRRAAGSFVDGDWSPGAESTFEIEGSIQPMSDRDLTLLPEGRRSGQRWKLYSTAELRTVSEETAEQADRVVHSGKELLVEDVKDYSGAPGGLAHFRYELVEEEA